MPYRVMWHAIRPPAPRKLRKLRKVERLWNKCKKCGCCARGIVVKYPNKRSYWACPQCLDAQGYPPG